MPGTRWPSPSFDVGSEREAELLELFEIAVDVPLVDLELASEVGQADAERAGGEGAEELPLAHDLDVGAHGAA